MVMTGLITSSEEKSVIVSVNEHGKRVGILCCNLYTFLGRNRRDCSTALLAGNMHDIGKLRVPADILNKPAKLTSEERALVEHHAIYSAEILASYRFNKEVVNSALYHHENEDGSGYPLGLFAVDIPYLAKVIHICDVFDALMEKRPYKKNLKLAECMEIMDDMYKYGKFNKDLYNSFKSMLGVRALVPNCYIDDTYYSVIRSWSFNL